MQEPAGCRQAGDRLEAAWRQAGGRLEAGWRQAGGRLEEVLNLGDCVDGMHHRFCAPEMLGEQVQGPKSRFHRPTRLCKNVNISNVFKAKSTFDGPKGYQMVSLH